MCDKHRVLLLLNLCFLLYLLNLFFFWSCFSYPVLFIFNLLLLIFFLVLLVLNILLLVLLVLVFFLTFFLMLLIFSSFIFLIFSSLVLFFLFLSFFLIFFWLLFLHLLLLLVLNLLLLHLSLLLNLLPSCLTPKFGHQMRHIVMFPQLRRWNYEAKWLMTDGVSLLSEPIPVFWGLRLLKHPNAFARHENVLKLNMKNDLQQFFFLCHIPELLHWFWS